MSLSSNRIKNLNKVENALRKAFPVFEPEGVVSFYIWGSLLRDDYDPSVSDIDLIFILSDRAPIDLPAKIKQYLAGLLPGLQKIGGQGLYLSELNGGPARSFFAQLHPAKVRSVLTEFSDWYYVAGQKFIRDDFKEADLSVEEEIDSHKQQIRDIIRNIDDPSRNYRQDLVKKGLELAYYKAVKTKGQFKLNYDTLEENALPQDKEIVKLLAEARKVGRYDSENFDSKIPLIQEFTQK